MNTANDETMPFNKNMQSHKAAPPMQALCNRTTPVIIRDAVPDDAAYLSLLAIRSKAHWGYSAEFMDACVNELSVSPGQIENCDFHYVVAMVNAQVAGFYALEGLSGEEIELGALFVDPDHIGTGVGKALVERAKLHAVNLGARKLNIQGDPNAVIFYRAAGGELTGSKESDSIPGRFLPTFQISLSLENNA
jgi:GNAT superfamily N-acetyltransferase